MRFDGYPAKVIQLVRDGEIVQGLSFRDLEDLTIAFPRRCWDGTPAWHIGSRVLDMMQAHNRFPAPSPVLEGEVLYPLPLASRPKYELIYEIMRRKLAVVELQHLLLTKSPEGGRWPLLKIEGIMDPRTKTDLDTVQMVLKALDLELMIFTTAIKKKG